MNREHFNNLDNLISHAEVDECQRCFVGHSHEAPWRDDLVSASNEVLPEFGLKPWYAADHFTPTKSLREKVIEMIANTHYGIYDLSYWRKDNESAWSIPRNVLIELGIAIALNRPTLLLRHAKNRIANAPIPLCLESISSSILEFSGLTTLKQVLRERLLQSTDTVPREDWWNRYCMFGSRVCEYREIHPQRHQWGLEKLHCHIADSPDEDQRDFRDVIEEILGRFDDVEFEYLDTLSLNSSYNFLLCSYCQAVRTTPFAIYRITSHTPPETFIAIGMSLALETQFSYKIPKILLTSNMQDIPSLLTGYDVVVAQNDYQRMTHLRNFMPQVVQEIRRKTWKARPLPFIQIVPRQNVEISQHLHAEQVADSYEEVRCQRCGKDVTNELSLTQRGDYICKSCQKVAKDDPAMLLLALLQLTKRTAQDEGEIRIPDYTIERKLSEGSIGAVYLVRHIKNGQRAALKVMLSKVPVDTMERKMFLREIEVIRSLHHKNVVELVESGAEGSLFCFLLEYCEGGSIYDAMKKRGGRLSIAESGQMMLQAMEGLAYIHYKGFVHCDIKPQNILLDGKPGNWVAKITGMGLAKRIDVFHDAEDDRLIEGALAFMPRERVANVKYIKPVSDVWSMGATCYNILTGYFPRNFPRGVDPLDVILHDEIIPIRQRDPLIPVPIAEVIDRSLSKDVKNRYQNAGEMHAAFAKALKNAK